MTDTPFVRYPHAARPRVGLDTAVVMDHAVVALADRRFMVALDAPSSCTCWPASSLGRRHGWANRSPPPAAGPSWTTIGRLLGLTATVARQRYGRVPLEH